MEEIVKYYTPKKEKDGKKLVFVFVAIFSIISLYVFGGFIREVVSDSTRLLNSPLHEKFLLLVGMIMVPLFTYDWIRQIIELWINAYTVELTEDRVIGYTAWNKKKN